MSGPIDDTTEYLIEEYALGRLEGEGLARAEDLLRADPGLRARADELRRDADLLSRALARAAHDPGRPVPDASLALLMDGALDELERASLEASLAGDIRAQARLAEIYRDANAILNDEPLPDAPVSSDPPATVIPFERSVRPAMAPSEPIALAASAVLVLVSLVVPARAGIALLFLALGAFGWWALQHGARMPKTPDRRTETRVGLVAALAAFAAGPFAGPYSLWCYVCSAAWYWYWLVHRSAPVTAVTERSVRESDGISEPRAGSGRG